MSRPRNYRITGETGKGVNVGIQSTLRSSPERFMAYNNGIVMVADEIRLGNSRDVATGIAWIKGLQIVNGGQTTASLYFTKKKYSEVDLSSVRVAAKIIVMRVQDPAKEEALVSDISRFANSQNAVRQSDLSANKPFHVEIEKISRTVYCPNGVSQWFYERAAGSYNTLLAREGTTPAKLKKIKDAIPTGHYCFPTFQIAPNHLPYRQLPALSRVELFLFLNSPRCGMKKNGAF